MGGIAFFDLTEGELFVYIVEKKGRNYVSTDRISAPLRAASDDGPIGIGRTFEDVEESYLSLPLTLLNFRIIELPFSEQERIREVLPFELNGLMLKEPEGAVLDACVLGKDNGTYKVLVVYVLRDVLKGVLERLKALKADPRIVTSVELAEAIGMDPSASEEAITERLLNPNVLAGEDRIRAATKQIGEPTINLRRGDVSFTADNEKLRRRVRLTVILAGFVFLIFLSDMALQIISTRKEISAVREEMRKTYSSLFPQEKKVTNELYQMKSHLKELDDKERVLLGISPLEFYLELTRVSRPGTNFTEITIDKERVLLKGECPSLSDVQQIKSNLEGFLTDVNISQAKPSSSNKVVFSITAKRRKL